MSSRGNNNNDNDDSGSGGPAAVADITTTLASTGLSAAATYDYDENDIAPINWEPVVDDDEQGKKEQDKEFIRYYERRGSKSIYSTTDGVTTHKFAARPFPSCNGPDMEPLVQFVRQPVQADGVYEWAPVVKTGTLSELNAFEAGRKVELIQAEADLLAMTEAKEPRDEAQLREQRKLVATLKVPFELFVPAVRPDNEEGDDFDTRKTGDDVITDRNIVDPRKETDRRFGRTIEMMKRHGAIPDSFKAGDIFGPNPSKEDTTDSWADEVENMASTPADSLAVSSFYGYIPKYHRPARFGLGHMGYDDVYTLQRDGIPFTEESAPIATWEKRIEAPIPFSFEGDTEVTTEVVTTTLERATETRLDNPALPLPRKIEVKPLYEEMTGRVTKNREIADGRRPRGRGSAGAPGVGRGGQYCYKVR